MAKELLPDALWARIAPLLPPEPPKVKNRLGHYRWLPVRGRTDALLAQPLRAPEDPLRAPTSTGLTSIGTSRSLAAWLRPHLPALPRLTTLTTSNSRERSAWTAWTAAHGLCYLCYTRDMTIKRLDHVSVVVDDLAAAIAFFTALGMTIEGEAPVEGPWVDRINALENVQVNIVMMRTPDGHGRLELTKFRNPKLVEIEPAIAPPNTLGLRSVMFTVESVDDTVARLRADGAELVGEVAQYEDKYRLCYMRGPAGIIVALAEELF